MKCNLIKTAVTFLAALTMSQAMSAYYVGNSLTDDMHYQGVEAMITNEGISFDWGRHMIPGAPLSYLWDNNTSGFCEPSCPPTALPTIAWDHLTLQVCVRHLDSDAENIKNYTDLAVQANPDVQVYVYVIWPDVSFGDYSEQWDRTYVPGSWDNSERTADYFYQLLARIRQDLDYVKPPRLVPIGFVMYELEQRMKAGQVNGYSTVHELYADNVHLGSAGEYCAGLTVFATLTGIDPRAKAVPSHYGTLDAGLVSAIQNTVYDVLTEMSNETGFGSGGSTAALPRSNFGKISTQNYPGGEYLLNGQQLQHPAAATPGTLLLKHRVIVR